MICWHRWSKWNILTQGNIERNYLYKGVIKKYVIGKFIVQKRVCDKCGKIKIREICTENKY